MAIEWFPRYSSVFLFRIMAVYLNFGLGGRWVVFEEHVISIPIRLPRLGILAVYMGLD